MTSRKTIQPAGSSRAFTLVELLVVIGIIAILIGVLLPALARARQSANSANCLSNLRQIGQAMQMYVNANKGSLPYGYWDGGVGTPMGPPNYAISGDWSTLLLNTMSGKYGTNYAELTGQAARLKEAFRDKDTLEGKGFIHYSAHPRLMPDLRLQEPDSLVPNPKPYLKPYKISRIRRSAEIVLIMDGAQIAQVPGNPDNQLWQAFATAYKLDRRNLFSGGQPLSFLVMDRPSARPDTGVDPGPNRDASTITSSADEPDGNIRWRHMNNKSANFLFVDGHAEPRQLKRASVPGTPGECDLKRSNILVNR